MTSKTVVSEVFEAVQKIDADRRAFRHFWLTTMVPVLLQIPLRYGDVTIAQHMAWWRWKEAYDE